MKQFCFLFVILCASQQSLYPQVIPGTVVDEPISAFLATPAAGSVTNIPVVILRYLPTSDGINIDVSKATDYWDLGEMTLEQMKANTDKYLVGLKFSLEEGSKFHGYKDPDAVPYLGYQVVKFLTIYDQIPISTTYRLGTAEVDGQEYGVFEPDFLRIYNDFALQQFIEINGVKEIWIWFGQCAMPGWPSYDPAIHTPENFVEFVESNMASPVTGDISNSHRFENDVPVASKTAVVYCYNFRRTQAEAVHNHGHQLESIYKYIAQRQDGTDDLFVRDFSGWGSGYSTPPLGRAGDCHHPPNTTDDYDYLNTTLVESDIEDWRPSVGTKKLVNADTWASIEYAWPAGYDFPQRDESQWYIYWMQNMPGYQSQIPHSAEHVMTNWWQFTAHWDQCNIDGAGLYCEDPLPVELTSFTATTMKHAVVLNWATETETNNYGFEIQRKTRTDWMAIGFKEGHGTTNTPHSYSFIDASACGRCTYRLKQIDRDGAFVYSKEVDVIVSAPTDVALGQNFPNPFNPSTAISFTLPSTAFVTLKIFDVLGRDVATIVSEELEGGAYTRSWNAAGMPSGVYFYRLQSEGYTETKRLMLSK